MRLVKDSLSKTHRGWATIVLPAMKKAAHQAAHDAAGG